MLEIYCRVTELGLVPKYDSDLGLATTIYHGGRECIKLGSISFASMDNDEFERFYNRTLDLILRKYLRGTDREQLIQELKRFY